MVSDFGMLPSELATREVLRAVEAERAARDAYEAERAARDAYQAERAARDAYQAERAARDAYQAERAARETLATTRDTVAEANRRATFELVPPTPLADAMKSLRIAQAISESPVTRMMGYLEESPAVRTMRQIENSPVVQMMRQIEGSPAVQLSRSIAENFKSLDAAKQMADAATLRGVFGDRRVLADISGVVALRDWGATAAFRDLGAVSQLIAPRLDAFTALANASRYLIEQADAVGRFETLPPYLQIAPTLEPYASASTLHLFLPDSFDVGEIHVIDLVAEELLDGVSAEFEARLASVDQRLLKPVRGAWRTALSDSEDHIRQSASSIRHVIEEMIKRLAPRDRAEAWVQQHGHGKKPPKAARKARSAGRWAAQLRFIMRHVDEAANASSSESVFGYLAETDLVDMLLLLERLNQAVHETEAHISEDELPAVLRRSMAFMTLLLDAYEFEAPSN